LNKYVVIPLISGLSFCPVTQPVSPATDAALKFAAGIAAACVLGEVVR
jgi:hypothetical protein